MPANTPTVERLTRLLAYFENSAAAVRAVLVMLADDPTRNARMAIPPTLRAAVALDGARRNGNGNGHVHHADRTVIRGHGRIGPGRPKGTGKGPGKRRAPGHASAAAIRVQRQRTADYLAQFDASEPRLIKGRILGAIVRRGYLKKKGPGYVRTSKPFRLDPSAAD